MRYGGGIFQPDAAVDESVVIADLLAAFGTGSRADFPQEEIVARLRAAVGMNILKFNPETCRINAGRAGRQPQMIPQVTSATLGSQSALVMEKNEEESENEEQVICRLKRAERLT